MKQKKQTKESAGIKVSKNLWEYLSNRTDAINNSKVFAGIMILFMNITSKHVNIKIPKVLESYLKNDFSRNVLIFIICWIGTRDFVVSIFLALFFIILFDYVLNEESPYCCLPESFTDYHVDRLEKIKKVDPLPATTAPLPTM
jgi:hypothetical protein